MEGSIKPLNMRLTKNLVLRNEFSLTTSRCLYSVTKLDLNITHDSSDLCRIISSVA